MTNPISRIITNHQTFVYFHTHEVTQTILDAAIVQHKSLELDISIAPDGEIYIGHPLAMYEFKNLPPPHNLPLDEVLRAAKAANLFLMFDVKDVRVLPRVQQAILEHGVDNCILHSCVEELVFRPFSSKLVVEPHWNNEQLPVDAVLAVKQATGVPVALCSRGISQELLDAKGQAAIVGQILTVVKGKAEVMVPTMPPGETTPLSLMQTLLDNGIVSLFNVDKRSPEDRPAYYLGSTDDLAHATVLESEV